MNRALLMSAAAAVQRQSHRAAAAAAAVSGPAAAQQLLQQQGWSSHQQRQSQLRHKHYSSGLTAPASVSSSIALTSFSSSGDDILASQQQQQRRRHIFARSTLRFSSYHYDAVVRQRHAPQQVRYLSEDPRVSNKNNKKKQETATTADATSEQDPKAKATSSEDPTTKTPSADGETAAADAGAATEEGDDTADAELSKREHELAAEVADLKNQLLRSLAEQDNTRRIAKTDVESARQFAIKSFAKSLLDVSDNLTRALDAVPEQHRSTKSSSTGSEEGEGDAAAAVLATLYEGIEMTNTGLTKAFAANGLQRYGAEDEPFDPNRHAALFEYADANKTPGTVGQVIKSGFLLHDRVLRPAEVGVVKKE